MQTMCVAKSPANQLWAESPGWGCDAVGEAGVGHLLQQAVGWGE
jgi:hypothetical protein